MSLLGLKKEKPCYKSVILFVLLSILADSADHPHRAAQDGASSASGASGT